MRAISRLVAALAFLDLTKVTGFAPAPSTTRWRSRPCSSARLALSSSKWDNLVDDEDEGPPVPPDMKYVPRNVIRQHQNFVDIREAGGEEMTNDIYVREPGSQVFWFSGKVARVSGAISEFMLMWGRLGGVSHFLTVFLSVCRCVFGRCGCAAMAVD